MTNGKNSFSDAIILEPERFSAYAFKENPAIKTYNDFVNGMYKAFNTPLGRNSMIDEEDMKVLFESDYTKDRIRQNTTKEEYKKAYEENEMIYLQPKEAVIISTIKVKKTEDRKGYTRQINRTWRPVHIKFLQVRKAKKQSLAKITKDYNDTFPLEERRTKKSIKSKLQRL